jgi:hypothetical protein
VPCQIHHTLAAFPWGEPARAGAATTLSCAIFSTREFVQGELRDIARCWSEVQVMRGAIVSLCDRLTGGLPLSFVLLPA